ncbi:MAG: chemotaxis protein CheB [Chitinophagaceae bacterium]|nr:chemotaxis protein CheB [Chitinophagaceae bacterium]
MRRAKLMVIGGSAGSLQVIMEIMSVIRPDFPLPVLIVLHRNSIFESNLEELFASRSQAIIKEVEEKEVILPGVIYIAPADYHVLIEEDQTFSLDYSERVNFSRPSIDVTFRCAADVYGTDLVCLLLSGGNADGVEGLGYVKERGGLTVVQDPVTAEVPYMPQHALSQVAVDFVVAAGNIPAFIKGLAFLPPV